MTIFTPSLDHGGEEDLKTKLRFYVRKSCSKRVGWWGTNVSCQLKFGHLSVTLIQTLLIQNLGQDYSGLKAELHLLSTSLLGIYSYYDIIYETDAKYFLIEI